MKVVEIKKEIDRVIVTFLYNPNFVEKVKTIKNNKMSWISKFTQRDV
jgi:hypothetical protein